MEEGIKLRQITKKEILVFCCNVNEIEQYIKYNLTVNFYKYNDIVLLKNKLKLLDKCIKLQIPIDTGMNRFGIKNIEEFNKILEILDNENILLTGIYTHLTKNSNSNIKYQIEQFNNFLAVKNFNNKSIHYITSSYLDNNLVYNYNCNFIRIGVANYTKTIKSTLNCIEIYSKIIDIKEIKPGETVGYNNTYVANKNIKVAIVSGGYYDGINSNLTGYSVKINNNYCKIIGKICMDIFFVDVSNVECMVDDLVNIISVDDCKLSIENMAEFLSCSPYEIIVNFKGRIKTIYKKD